MKSIKLLTFLASLIFLLTILFFNKVPTMSTEPKLKIEIMPNKEIDNDLQINIRTINNRNDKYSIKNELYTLINKGNIFPLPNKNDFLMYEIFIIKADKFAYIAGENIYFSVDETSIRGGSNRKGKILISPHIEDDFITLEYQQYYKDNQTKTFKKFKLSESYRHNNYVFDGKTELEDFTRINNSSFPR